VENWSQIGWLNLIYHAPMRLHVILALTACLSGCGLVGTAATTAAGASVELEQAKQAKQIEAQVQQQVQSSVQQDRARVDQVIEKDSQ
jgi:hypothetical protein